MRTPADGEVTEIEVRIHIVDNHDGTCTHTMTYTIDGHTVMDQTGVSPVWVSEGLLELGSTMAPTLVGAIADEQSIDLSQVVTIPNAPDDIPGPP